jgi:shikimate dehydrogenase
MPVGLAPCTPSLTMSPPDSASHAILAAYVLGYPIHHSLSPTLHNAAFEQLQISARMTTLAVEPGRLADTLTGLRGVRFLGASVTLPHKETTAALCDELSPAARTIGAVNCLEIEGKRLIGHNTDSDGFGDALKEADVTLTGKRVAILGSGGAARAVAHGAREARAIEVIARRAHDVRWAVTWPWTDETLLEVFARSDIIVDCTSTGLAAETEQSFVDALPLAALRANATVVSLVYHRKPLLLSRAAGLGLTTVDGLCMLLHQGARAFEIWTHQAAPVETMRNALRGALARRPI